MIYQFYHIKAYLEYMLAKTNAHYYREEVRAYRQYKMY